MRRLWSVYCCGNLWLRLQVGIDGDLWLQVDCSLSNLGLTNVVRGDVVEVSVASCVRMTVLLSEVLLRVLLT